MPIVSKVGVHPFSVSNSEHHTGTPIILTRSLCRCSIPQPIVAHVLQDLVTEVVLVTAGVLVGPLDGEDRSLIVVKAAHVVAASVVVLGVKEPVGVVPVSPRLIKTVV